MLAKCVFGNVATSALFTVCVTRGASVVCSPSSTAALFVAGCASKAPGTLPSAAAMQQLKTRFRCFTGNPLQMDDFA